MVPHLLDVEVASVARRWVLAGRLDAAGGATIVRRLLRLPLRRVDHVALLPRAFALHPSATAYDAVYLALAEALEWPLVTADAALAAVPGCRAVVEVHARG